MLVSPPVILSPSRMANSSFMLCPCKILFRPFEALPYYTLVYNLACRLARRIISFV